MIKNIVRLHGNIVDLCVMRTDEEALEKYITWMNDESFAKWLGRNSFVTDWRAEEKFLKKDHSEGFNIVLKDGTLVGNCGCYRVGDSRNYTLGICIGEVDAQNKGIGKEVIEMLIRFAFEERNAHRVRITLSSGNERAFHCYSKAGLKQCGVEHETHFYGGKWYDTVYMELLDHDYFWGEDI